MELWLLLIGFSALLAGLASIFQKVALNREHAMEFSAVVAIMAFLFSLPLWFIADFSNISWSSFLLMALVTFLASSAYILVAKGFRHMQISEASPLLAFSPAVTLVFAIIFLGESISLMQFFGIFLLLCGTYVLESNAHQKLGDPVRSLFRSTFAKYIFLALIIYGFCSVIDKYVLNQGVDPFAYLAIVHLFLVFYLCSYLYIFHDGFRGVEHGFSNVGLLIALVAFLTLGYRIFQIWAVSLEQVSLVIPLKRMSILFATIIGGEILHEGSILKKSFACIIMLCGALLIVL